MRIIAKQKLFLNDSKEIISRNNLCNLICEQYFFRQIHIQNSKETTLKDISKEDFQKVKKERGLVSSICEQ